MQIIGGVISYEDGVKTVAGDQFSPTRKVRVELNFSIDQGEDADGVLLDVFAKAKSQVNSHLGLKDSTAAVKVAVEHHNTNAKLAADLPKPKPKAPVKAPGKTKADLAADAGVAPKPVQTDLEDELNAPPKSATPIADAMAAENDALDDLTAGEPAKEITDADLNAAVRDKNVAPFNTAENPGAPRIRKLVTTYLSAADAEKQPVCRLIPQAKRTAFLEALKELA